MIVDIWISGQKLEMYSGEKIRHTLQVNDIAEVKDRQSSFTNSFSVPKTPHNQRVFDALGISSDTSRIPYEKHPAQMKYEGFDFINKGWANITETADDYKLYLYSGIIEFFKAIENKTLGKHLDLSAINHSKTVQTVIESFDNNDYKYLIADFGGDFLTANENVNVEYLMPAVNAKFLWDKIHQTYGFTYSGSTFADLETKWISYPKAKNISENIVLYGSAKFNKTYAQRTNISPTFGYSDLSYHFFSAESIEQINGEWINYGTSFNVFGLPHKGHFRIPETGYYKIEITGNVATPFVPSFSQIKQSLHLIINGNGRTPLQAINDGNAIKTVERAHLPGFNCAYTTTIPLSAGDFIALGFYNDDERNFFDTDVEIKISKVNQTEVSFTNELAEFSIKDFVKEILNLYGLTPFTSEHSNNIEYLTIKERLDSEAVDWTDKYVERVSEKYIYNDYAQSNIFRYKYTEKDAAYNDASVYVNNKNIPEEKVVYDSKFYSPEKELSKIKLGANTIDSFVFKMWEKEIKRDNTIDYKSKDNRFYWINEVEYQGTATFESSLIGNPQSVTNFPLGVFAGISLQDYVSRYYNELENIIENSRLHEITLDLNIIDLLQIDFRKLYYFNQEQQYYILNKLIFDENKQSGEFVRVTKPYYFTPQAPTDPQSVDVKVVYDSSVVYAVTKIHVFSLTQIFPSMMWDNVKIITLPSMGVLPGISVNQIIASADIQNNSALTFKPEGATDNQFTGDYSTSFDIRGVNADLTESTLITINLHAIDLSAPVVTTNFCFVGTINQGMVDIEGNPIYGYVEYIDASGVTQVYSPIYQNSGTITITAQSIINTYGVNQVNC